MRKMEACNEKKTVGTIRLTGGDQIEEIGEYDIDAIKEALSLVDRWPRSVRLVAVRTEQINKRRGLVGNWLLGLQPAMTIDEAVDSYVVVAPRVKSNLT